MYKNYIQAFIYTNRSTQNENEVKSWDLYLTWFVEEVSLGFQPVGSWPSLRRL